MSVFTPFRNKACIRTVAAVGGAIKLAHMVNAPEWSWSVPAMYAQQAQRVNVDQIAGSSVTFVPLRCDNSTGILSTVVDIQSTQGQVVAGSTGRIYVCGWSFTSSAVALSPQWVEGTSTDCITGQASKSANYTFSSFSGMVVPNAGGVQFVTSSGASLCLDVPSSGDLGGILTYISST